VLSRIQDEVLDKQLLTQEFDAVTMDGFPYLSHTPEAFLAREAERKKAG